ncbi:MAG: hypothetical protein SGARI_001217, partial [Bacillariaceae sp.]
MASTIINNTFNTVEAPLKAADAAMTRSRKSGTAACPALLNFALPCSGNLTRSKTEGSYSPLQVCDDALKVLEFTTTSTRPSSPQRRAYQKELLLDNLTFLQEALDASRQNGMDFENEDLDEDLLSQGDIEDDDHSWDEDEDEASYSSHLPMSLFCDYQLPLRNSESHSSSMDVYAQVSKYQRELLLDRGVDDLQKYAMSGQQQGHEDDDLSLGDVESDIEDEDVFDDGDDIEVEVQGQDYDQDYVLALRAPRSIPS